MPGLLSIIPEPTPAPTAKPLFVVGTPKGLIEPGNIDLLARPTVKNEDGSVSTVSSMSFEDDDGTEILIPTILPNGKIVSKNEAIKRYYDTGEHLGKFSSPEAATTYAVRLHDQQAEFYGK